MKKCGQCPGCKVASLLVIVGAINWGLFGVFGINLVTKIAGEATLASKIIYGLIGVAGILKIVSCVIKCPGCKTEPSSGSGSDCCAK